MQDTSCQQPCSEWPELGVEPFQFHCHAGVTCFLSCCRQVELRLFPYDILRLKERLSLSSAEFLAQHTRLSPGAHPFFPAVMLNMRAEGQQTCPFLAENGCSVYKDRPSACRTYPLERAVEKTADGSLRSRWFLTQHAYCKGHLEAHPCTVKQWEREQQLTQFNLFNDLWAEVDAFFATNPWQGEGQAGPLQQLAFMVCYNLDAFGDYVRQHNLLAGFRLDRDRRRRIEQDDSELLKFGFDWLLHVLGGRRTLTPR
ncbi:YkgJ family cysteine cluster protein [Candidatus Electronema sp. PJ]|uniref:YkgJ family cysteine cluster protein n=1 Tax=Candidatus Electronema sp. PJ TaxID=3401572 RepID=UPI003AA9CEC0